jgi:hypothetical protein
MSGNDKLGVNHKEGKFKSKIPAAFFGIQM